MKLNHRTLVNQLRTDTTALALPDGRRVGQPGHDVAREYLGQRLTEIGLTPWEADHFELSYDLPHPTTRELTTFTNLVGVIPGRDRSLAPILLGAHYDSIIDAPCADDNATSIALNLAIAEEFKDAGLERDLIIALFDSEEPPHFYGSTMGSLRFEQDFCRDKKFAAVIVSDLIGHDFKLSDLGIDLPGAELVLPQAGKTLFVLGAESDAVFPDIVERAAKKTKGIRVFPTLSRYLGAPSDHWPFEMAGQPTLFLSCGRGRYYHHELDDLEWINFNKLARITEFTASCIRQIDLTPGGEALENPDPFAFEARMIRQSVGPLLPVVLKRYGLTMPESREDLDELIGMLVVGA